jgi:hypothetical protein
MDPSQIQGLPPGSIVSPISPPPATIPGLPPGSTVSPIAAAPPSTPAAAPTAPATPAAVDTSGVENDYAQMPKDFDQSFKTQGAQTLKTLGRVLHPMSGGSALDLVPGVRDAVEKQAAQASPGSVSGYAGGAVENVLEWLSGGEAMEGLGWSEKLSKLAPVAKVLEKFPRLAEALNIGIKATPEAETIKSAAAKGAATAGAGSGAQAAAHGASPTEAAEAAGIGALAGGTMGSLAQAGTKAITHIAPTVEDIGGTELTRLASQHEYATPAQTMAATAEHNPAVQRGQQKAGKEIIGNAAKKTAAANLGELNEGRTVEPTNPTVQKAPYKFQIKGPGTAETTEGATAHQPRKQQIGTRAVEGKGPSERQVYPDAAGETNQVDVRPNGDEAGTQGSHRAPTYQMQPEVKPGSQIGVDVVKGGGDIVTEDPTVIKAHIATLNDAIDEATDPAQRQQLQAQRADAQRQMSEYHASRQGQDYSPYKDQPTFSPVEISKAVSRVGSFGDAADALEDGAKEVYNRLDDVTGGRFTDLREENKRAWNAVANGGGDAAQARLADTTRKLTAMLDGTDGQVGDSVKPVDLAYANEAWKKAQVLRDVHSKVEGAFDTSIGASDRANAYRGFNGNRLRQNLKALTDQYGERPLVRIIGQDQLDNLTRLADITRNQADRAKFGGGVNHVAQWIVRNEGKVASGVAAAGGYAGHLIGGTPESTAAGAATGEAAYLVARRVMRAIATNPKVGQQFITAIQYGARPTFYAPMIGQAVRSMQQEPQQ